MRPRFTIAALAVALAACGLGFAALREADEVWASCAFTLTLLLMGLAILGAAFRRGRSRAFFAGFAAFGLAYLGLWGMESVRPHLATTKLLEFAGGRPTRAEELYSVLVEGQGSAFSDFDGDGKLDLYVANRATARRSGSMGDFLRVGHSLFALVAAMVGGVAARCFQAPRTDPPS